MWSSDLPSLTDYQVFKNLFISFKLVEVVTILAFTLFNVSLFPDQLTTVSIKNEKKQHKYFYKSFFIQLGTL